VDTRQIRRYEAGEQQPVFTAAVAIAAALRVPLTELAWLPTEPAARSDQTLPPQPGGAGRRREEVPDLGATHDRHGTAGGWVSAHKSGM
jgi:hypothetical protein